MTASQAFQDVRKELENQWKYSSNIFPVYRKVTKAALDNLVEKLPKKFERKAEDYAQKSQYKKKSRVDKTKEKDQVTKYMNWESSDNTKANAYSTLSCWEMELEDWAGYVKNT